ncbi:MAG: hypothetical protein LUG65_05130 [Clostridiales bacterium]|nr:hypothetical protein [Clostridiales bacterium]
MLESLRQWILAVTAVSLLTALCQALMPPGPVKRVSNLTCGLLIFIVLVQPAVRADYTQLLADFQDYYAGLGDYDTALVETNSALTEELIARNTAAYIEDKAEGAGIACAVTVSCGQREEVPMPETVTVSGSLSQTEQAWLIDLAETELGLEATAVQFTEKEGGE